ncbi:hypothetical protein D3C71_1572320 [compost metagenome]
MHDLGGVDEFFDSHFIETHADHAADRQADVSGGHCAFDWQFNRLWVKVGGGRNEDRFSGLAVLHGDLLHHHGNVGRIDVHPHTEVGVVVHATDHHFLTQRVLGTQDLRQVIVDTTQCERHRVVGRRVVGQVVDHGSQRDTAIACYSAVAFVTHGHDAEVDLLTVSRLGGVLDTQALVEGGARWNDRRVTQEEVDQSLGTIQGGLNSVHGSTSMLEEWRC